MSKTINIITNIHNGAGLEQDAKLFAALLESLGHRPRLIAYDVPHTGISYPADINIFMEVMLPNFLQQAKENWLMPNSEWWNGRIGDCALPFISKILCKTQDCLRIWNAKCPGKCVYTDFESQDYFEAIPVEHKEINFLHLAGNSRTKNTEAVVNAWKQFQIPYNLEVVIRDISYIPQCLGVKNITYHNRLPENHVKMALNYRWFHLMPSHYEGFGHAIHEALGCGGIVLTTDAPPMNETNGICKELLIPYQSTWKKELATCYTVSPESVYKTVMKAISLSAEQRLEISQKARVAFIKDRDEFRQRIKELLC